MHSGDLEQQYGTEGQPQPTVGEQLGGEDCAVLRPRVQGVDDLKSTNVVQAIVRPAASP